MKVGVPKDRLTAEIGDAVVILRQRRFSVGPFSRLWGVSDRRALTNIVADLRFRAEQIERLNKSIVGSQMGETFLWLDRSKGRRDWKTLEQTMTNLPEMLRAYASCVEGCYATFRERNRLKAFRPEEIFERRLIELVTDSTDSPHWREVSALLYWLYEEAGVQRETNQEAVRKRHSRPMATRRRRVARRRHRTN